MRILLLLLSPLVAVVVANNIKDTANNNIKDTANNNINDTATATGRKNDNIISSERLLSSFSSSSSPIIIPNAINNATATILQTASVGDIPAKTWISFNDGPMVEVLDDSLSLEAIEEAYNKTQTTADSKKRILLEPFSFESPYADPVCIFNGTIIVKANVTSSTTMSCESPPIDNDRGAGVPLHISSNGGHDVVSAAEVFVYLSSQEREPLVIQPNHGPPTGGTRVLVKGITNGPIVNPGGSGDDTPNSHALCKFGSHISHAIEVGSNGDYVVCLSPPRSANDNSTSTPVDISIMGQSNVFSGVQVLYRYDDDFSIASLHPASGLVIGGTDVHIRGGPFHYNPNEIECKFGDEVVPATYHDMGEISCTSPRLGWINEIQQVSVFTMASNPEIQTISATVDDYINEVHICHTHGESDITDDDLGRGFRLVAPGGSIEYPLSHHTRWITHNETAIGFTEALEGTGLFPIGFTVNRTGPLSNQAYKWEIILPKDESFGGETLHVVNTGGGAVKLRGTNVSVSCVLEKKGTQKLGGQFKLLFPSDSSNVSLESSRPIPHNATNNDIKYALEELDGIDLVEVNSASLDLNATGSDAFQWHVTFTSLKNAGDVPLLTVEDYSSDVSTVQLLGSNSAIDIKETRKGTSHAVYSIRPPPQATNFSVLFDGIESQVLGIETRAASVVEALEAIGSSSIVVEKYQNEYFFIDIMGYPLDGGRLQAKFFTCNEINNIPSSCSSELQIAMEHRRSTSTQLGGHFTLHYPSETTTCKTCLQSTTSLISAFASAHEIKSALEQLDLVDEVKIVITESDRYEKYKLPVQSGIVGLSRNFYIHFIQNQSFSTNLDDKPTLSTSYCGDLPLLEINPTNVKGTKTRDTVYSLDYNAKVIEVVKGSALNFGGSVEVAVSLNGGHDWSIGQNNPLFKYKPVPIVTKVTPAHGSIRGGTAITVQGDNFSRESAQMCLFWGNGASIVNGTKSGLIEAVAISKYGADSDIQTQSVSEVQCSTPPTIIPQHVHVAVIANEDVTTLGGSLQARGEIFRYHQDIDIQSIYPASSTVTGNESLNIFGGPFFPNEGLHCMFGDGIVSGTYHSVSHVTCMTPPHASGSYAVEVTQNGQDYTQSGHVIRFYQACKVNRIVPLCGPAMKAGTNVHVFGEKFVNSTSLHCRFDAISVPATYVNSSTIYCSAPPVPTETLESMQIERYYPQTMKGRLVQFEVSNNGQDFTSSGLEFLFLKDIEVTSISRKEGPSLGDTPIFISGTNFGK